MKGSQAMALVIISLCAGFSYYLWCQGLTVFLVWAAYGVLMTALNAGMQSLKKGEIE